MPYNYTAYCWFPTSSNNLILPSQFWQIRVESYWLHCSKCWVPVLLWYKRLFDHFQIFVIRILKGGGGGSLATKREKYGQNLVKTWAKGNLSEMEEWGGGGGIQSRIKKLPLVAPFSLFWTCLEYIRTDDLIMITWQFLYMYIAHNTARWHTCACAGGIITLAIARMQPWERWERWK